MKACDFVKGDYRKKEGYVPQGYISDMDFVFETKVGPTRSDKRKQKHFLGRKNTRGFYLGFNQKLWMEYTSKK